MSILAFIAAAALAVLAFDALALLGRRTAHGRLDVPVVLPDEEAAPVSAWQALLMGLWPSRFHPERARTREDVVALLRRAGYPWPTTGAFYAHAVRTFGVFAAVGLALAGVALAAGGPLPAAVAVFLALAFVGLRRPYSRLRRLARERAEAMHLNMLPVLSALHAYLQAGMGVQEALREVGHVGGPFANLLGFLLARMQVESVQEALERTRQHLPDPGDPIAGRFLDAVEAHFTRGRPLLDTLEALVEDLRAEHADRTAERVALTRRQAALFGIFSVLGMLITLLWPLLAR